MILMMSKAQESNKALLQRTILTEIWSSKERKMK